ncbi:hypothetical protein DFO54_10447 [Erwinia sp. AG740]|nr:hypothetical protein DFO54_10447 [Erwinia sp. AG740]
MARQVSVACALKDKGVGGGKQEESGARNGHAARDYFCNLACFRALYKRALSCSLRFFCVTACINAV